jgi:hypothetical protein
MLGTMCLHAQSPECCAKGVSANTAMLVHDHVTETICEQVNIPAHMRAEVCMCLLRILIFALHTSACIAHLRHHKV